MDRQRKADMMLVLATGFWGISNCLIAICLRDMQPVTLNAFRFLSAFVVLGAVFHKRVLRASRETWRYSVLVGLSLVAIYLGATYGVLYTSVSNAGFIGAMTVLFTPFFEFVVYRKRPDRKLGFALAVCMAGMALLTLNEALRPAPGDIICLLVPTFYAADLMVTEKAVAKPEVDPIALGVLQTAVAGVVMLGLSLLLETPSLPGSPKVWAAALFLGVFCHPERRAAVYHGEPRELDLHARAGILRRVRLFPAQRAPDGARLFRRGADAREPAHHGAGCAGSAEKG